MSGTIGVVGPSYWSYVAAVMAEVLRVAVQKNSLKKTDIPTGVLADALRFSKLVLEKFELPASSNPPATLNAYIMAMKVTERVTGRYRGAPLLAGCRLIVDLERVDGLSGSEILPTIDFMARFFLELHKMGEEERYEKAMAGEYCAE